MAVTTGRQRAVNHAVILVPLVVTAYCFGLYTAAHIEALDFHYEYWVAGWRVMHGQSPYVWSIHQRFPSIAFAYPALAGLMFVPFALISRGLADLIFTIACVASAPASLFVLGVRDRRIYGLVLLWATTITAWQSANLTLLLTLGIASVWRYRDRPIPAGLLTALLISLKPVVWPLALWLLVTRRFAATGWTLLAGIALNLFAWSVVGFSRIQSYLHVTGSVTALFHRLGYSLQSLALRCGLGVLSGPLVVVCCAALLVVMLRWRKEDCSSLALTVVMMLALSPLTWNQYFEFMLVPLAIAFPRFDRIWLAPLLLWACSPHGNTWWEPWLFWLVTLYVTRRILDRPGRKTAGGPGAAIGDLLTAAVRYGTGAERSRDRSAV
jgi:hypothetical protein